MTRINSAPHWRAISALQFYRTRGRPNSLQHDAADHAIGLLLSAGRPEGAYLVRNAYRDGRSIVLRKRKREAARSVPLYRQESGGLEIAVETQARPDRTYLESLPNSAEANLTWTDRYVRLRAAVGARNMYASAVLDGWRDGEEVEETARALGISTAYVKKLRQLARTTAWSMFGPADSA